MAENYRLFAQHFRREEQGEKSSEISRIKLKDAKISIAAMCCH